MGAANSSLNGVLRQGAGNENSVIAMEQTNHHTGHRTVVSGKDYETKEYLYGEMYAVLNKCRTWEQDSSKAHGLRCSAIEKSMPAALKANTLTAWRLPDGPVHVEWQEYKPNLQDSSQAFLSTSHFTIDQ